MSDLSTALEESRPRIEAALAEAQRELAALRDRERELEALIRRAQAALGDEAASAPLEERAGRPRTLHEAMMQALDERGNDWMSAEQLAAAVNARQLYRKRDGSPLEASQIHARASSYALLFEKDGRRFIRRRIRERKA